MPVPRARFSRRAKDELGAQGVRELLDHVWAVDCQRCGESLGGVQPSVGVTAYPGFISASLYHQHCRSPDWRDDPVAPVDPGAHLTFHWFDVAARTDEGGRYLPMLILNPSMESLFMEKAGGVWAVRPAKGGTPFGETLALTAAPGAHVMFDTAWAPAGFTAATVYFDCDPRWRVLLHHAIAGNVRRRGGLLVVLTHALDPEDIPCLDDDTVLRTLSDSAHTVAAWVSLTLP